MNKTNAAVLGTGGLTTVLWKYLGEPLLGLPPLDPTAAVVIGSTLWGVIEYGLGWLPYTEAWEKRHGSQEPTPVRS